MHASQTIYFDIESATDYYPFGMGMPGSTFSSSNYRYSYNGKENDNEVKGNGNSLDFGARIYDSRLGRWLSMDPLSKKHPEESPYVYTSNNPIFYVDPNGKDKIWYFNIILKDGTTITVATKRIINDQVSAHYEENYYGSPSISSTDVKQTITLDLRNNTISVSGEEDDYSSSHSIGYYFSKKLFSSNTKKEDNKQGEQDGGWTFTSEFAKYVDGPKTKAKKGSSGLIKIDVVLIALGKASGSPKLPNNLKLANFGKIVSDLKVSLSSKAKNPVCELCGKTKDENGNVLDTSGLNLKQENIQNQTYEQFHNKKK